MIVKVSKTRKGGSYDLKVKFILLDMDSEIIFIQKIKLWRMSAYLRSYHICSGGLNFFTAS